MCSLSYRTSLINIQIFCTCTFDVAYKSDFYHLYVHINGNINIIELKYDIIKTSNKIQN